MCLTDKGKTSVSVPLQQAHQSNTISVCDRKAQAFQQTLSASMRHTPLHHASQLSTLHLTWKNNDTTSEGSKHF